MKKYPMKKKMHLIRREVKVLEDIGIAFQMMKELKLLIVVVIKDMVVKVLI